MIGHLTAAYHEACRLGQDAGTPGLCLGSEPPDWNIANLIVAYGIIVSLAADYARRSERQGGLSFAGYLQEQALAVAVAPLEPPGGVTS